MRREESLSLSKGRGIAADGRDRSERQADLQNG